MKPTWEQLALRYKDKRIVITGASGFIASGILRYLTQVPCFLVRVMRKPSTENFHSKAQIHDIIGDVRDYSTWEQALPKAEIIFHLAAQTSASQADKDPSSDLEHNVLPMIHLFTACRRLKISPIIILASTVTVAGIAKQLPVNESFEDHPITIYDLHKQMAEGYLKYHTRLGAGQGTVLRLANVYGPGSQSSQVDRGILNLMIRKALAGETLTIFGKGDALRDYSYIDDIAMGFLLAPLHIDSLNGQHYILGSGQGYTISDAIHLIAKTVKMKTKKSVSVIHVDPPSTLGIIETRNFTANAQRFSEATGWTPFCTFPQGIDLTIEAFL